MARLLFGLGVAAVIFTIYAVADCAFFDRTRIRGLQRGWWIVIILFVPIIGGLLWFIIGRGRANRVGSGRGRTLAPDDDAEFLRRLREDAAQDERIRRLEQELADLDADDPLKHTKPGRVAVAMSGGVDSAVALLRAGDDAVGVTLRLWIDRAGPSSERACCSPEAVVQARETCHALGLPHVTLDLREAFHAAVVGPFVEGYAAGLTPNPCMRCNGRFRFDRLVDFDRLNATRFAALAVELETGREALFDTATARLGPDHIRASGALMPTVPPVEIDGVAYVDGGFA